MDQQRSLQGAGDQNFGHIGPHLPAHHVLGEHIPEGAEVGPGPAG